MASASDDRMRQVMSRLDYLQRILREREALQTEIRTQLQTILINAGIPPIQAMAQSQISATAASIQAFRQSIPTDFRAAEAFQGLIDRLSRFSLEDSRLFEETTRTIVDLDRRGVPGSGSLVRLSAITELREFITALKQVDLSALNHAQFTRFMGILDTLVTQSEKTRNIVIQMQRDIQHSKAYAQAGEAAGSESKTTLTPPRPPPPRSDTPPRPRGIANGKTPDTPPPGGRRKRTKRIRRFFRRTKRKNVRRSRSRSYV